MGAKRPYTSHRRMRGTRMLGRIGDRSAIFRCKIVVKIRIKLIITKLIISAPANNPSKADLVTAYDGSERGGDGRGGSPATPTRPPRRE